MYLQNELQPKGRLVGKVSDKINVYVSVLEDTKYSDLKKLTYYLDRKSATLYILGSCTYGRAETKHTNGFRK